MWPNYYLLLGFRYGQCAASHGSANQVCTIRLESNLHSDGPNFNQKFAKYFYTHFPKLLFVYLISYFFINSIPSYNRARRAGPLIKLDRMLLHSVRLIHVLWSISLEPLFNLRAFYIKFNCFSSSALVVSSSAMVSNLASLVFSFLFQLSVHWEKQFLRHLLLGFHLFIRIITIGHNLNCTIIIVVKSYFSKYTETIIWLCLWFKFLLAAELQAHWASVSLSSGNSS